MRFGSRRDDAFEHISEQCHRRNAIEFGGLNECHGDCPVTGSAIGAGEERAAAIWVSFGSTVSHSSLAVGNIAIERIGRLPHTVKKGRDDVRRNAISKMLRHPDRQLVVREIFSNKLFEAVDVLNVPNGGAWHLKKYPPL